MEGATMTESGPSLDHNCAQALEGAETHEDVVNSSSDPSQSNPGDGGETRLSQSQAVEDTFKHSNDVAHPSKHAEPRKDVNEETASEHVGTEHSSKLQKSTEGMTVTNQEPTILVTNHDSTSQEVGEEETSRRSHSPEIEGQKEGGTGSTQPNHTRECSRDMPKPISSNVGEIVVKEEKNWEQDGQTNSLECSAERHANLPQEKMRGPCGLIGQACNAPAEEMGEGSVGPLSPLLTPAPPPNHQHIQTQVSLEAPSSHSVATSPMTPPVGSGDYFFPYSFRKAGLNSDDLPQPQYRSVATAPMSPRTPTVTVPQSPCPDIKVTSAANGSSQQGSLQVAQGAGEKGAVSQVGGNTDRPGAVPKQPGNASTKSTDDTPPIGSSATILSTLGPAPGQEVTESTQDQQVECAAGAGIGQPGSSLTDHGAACTIASQESKRETASLPGRGHFDLGEARQLTVEDFTFDDTQSHDPPVEGSLERMASLPSPLLTPLPPPNHHHIQTQVSLEAPSSHSVATSPMTPPVGSGDYFFPYSFKKPGLNTGDLPQPQYRSVATAPMSPRTPTVIVPQSPCPDIKVTSASATTGGSQQGSLQEAHGGSEKGVASLVTESDRMDAQGGANHVHKEGECEVTDQGKAEDTQQDAIQSVRWDEKGMTWEVYGAAVEVEVLGTAIQKHLDKQVDEPGKPLSPPVSPPLSPPPAPPTDQPSSSSPPDSSPPPPPHSPPEHTSALHSDGGKAEGECAATEEGDADEAGAANGPGADSEVGVAAEACAPGEVGEKRDVGEAKEEGLVEEVAVAEDVVVVTEVSTVEEAADGQEAETKKKRRRNPVRALLRNMRRPRCCFRTQAID